MTPTCDPECDLSLLIGSAVMVIEQFHGRLVRQYVVDSVGLGITSYITVLCVQGILILSLLIFMPRSKSVLYIDSLFLPDCACAIQETESTLWPCRSPLGLF